MCEWRTIARSPTSSRMADRQEVERAAEIRFARDLEVGGGDRSDEAVVEGLREAKPTVNPVPAEPQRQLVDAQLAGVKDAEHLDAREVAPQELTVLGDRVLAQMPRVIGLLGAGRGERQPVRRRDVGQRRGG